MDATRRGFLGAVGGAIATTAGCAAPGRTTPAATDRSATEADRRYARVYEGVSESVARVRTYGGSVDGGQGSAFVYDADHVVTNQHVVGTDPSTVQVQYATGEWTAVDVVGADPYSDLAVLETDGPVAADPLPLVERVPDIGTEVLVVGSPLGLENSATQGIISGRNRSIPSVNGYSIADAIQTDAALNPGNSGGPIVTLDGEVVAVATATIPGTDNLGFGVSAPLARRVAPELAANGRYDHPHMGIGVLGVEPPVAEANDLPAVRGVYVSDVDPDGPADGVLRGTDEETTVDGVRVPVGGDVVIGIDDADVHTPDDLSRHLALETVPGDVVAVRRWRDGSEGTVDLELGARPDPT